MGLNSEKFASLFNECCISLTLIANIVTVSQHLYIRSIISLIVFSFYCIYAFHIHIEVLCFSSVPGSLEACKLYYLFLKIKYLFFIGRERVRI